MKVLVLVRSKSRLKNSILYALLWMCMIDIAESCFEVVKIRIEDEL